MKIDINDHRKIYSIQHDFSAVFPNLKIEFHARPHKTGGVPSEKSIATDSKTLGECRVEHNKGIITITPHMTAAELQDHFSDVYGLSVNVLKRSGNNWVELENKTKLSLEEQNK